LGASCLKVAAFVKHFFKQVKAFAAFLRRAGRVGAAGKERETFYEKVDHNQFR
jgi:hypothetical protein